MMGNPNNSRRLEAAEMQRRAAKRDREIERALFERIERKRQFDGLIAGVRRRDRRAA